jgi:hypothetical protein
MKNEKTKKRKMETGIWIDSTKAIIVTLQDGKEAESNLIF